MARVPRKVLYVCLYGFNVFSFLLLFLFQNIFTGPVSQYPMGWKQVLLNFCYIKKRGDFSISFVDPFVMSWATVSAVKYMKFVVVIYKYSENPLKQEVYRLLIEDFWIYSLVRYLTTSYLIFTSPFWTKNQRRQLNVSLTKSPISRRHNFDEHSEMEFLNGIFIRGFWVWTRVFSDSSFVWFSALIYRSTKFSNFLV